MKRKRIPSIFVSIVFVFLAMALFMLPVYSGFSVTTSRENERLAFFSTNEPIVTVGWRHSVELEPWMETYQVTEEGTLIFLETRFKAYGAGVPSIDGKVVANENGFIVIQGIEREIDHYSLFYTPESNYYLLIDGQAYPLSDFIPADTGIYISYNKLTFSQWLYYELEKGGRMTCRLNQRINLNRY
jgi:hypothetical protein